MALLLATVEYVDSLPGTELDTVAVPHTELLMEVAVEDNDDGDGDVGDAEFSPGSISPRVTSDALN